MFMGFPGIGKGLERGDGAAETLPDFKPLFKAVCPVFNKDGVADRGACSGVFRQNSFCKRPLGALKERMAETANTENNREKSW